MDAFEKWADDCDESDEKYYVCPVGSAGRRVAKDAFRAGLRRAAALLRNVEWTDAAMATAGFDEQCEDIYSAAILKEADA